MGDATKRAPPGRGIEYPVSGLTSLPQTKLFPAGVCENISPGGALFMTTPRNRGYIMPIPSLPLYRWIAPRSKKKGLSQCNAGPYPKDETSCISFFFFFFNLTYSRWTSSLPSCLWSLRIFPSLPGSRLTIFYRDASSALLQLVNQWLNLILLTHVPTLSVTRERTQILLW